MTAWKKATRICGVRTAVGRMCAVPCPTAFSIGWSASSDWCPTAAGAAERAFIAPIGHKASQSNRLVKPVRPADSSERLCPARRNYMQARFIHQFFQARQREIAGHQVAALGSQPHSLPLRVIGRAKRVGAVDKVVEAAVQQQGGTVRDPLRLRANCCYCSGDTLKTAILGSSNGHVKNDQAHKTARPRYRRASPTIRGPQARHLW
jgi:hypothetical protein